MSQSNEQNRTADHEGKRENFSASAALGTDVDDAKIDARITYPSYKSFDRFIDVERLKSLDDYIAEKIKRHIATRAEEYFLNAYRLDADSPHQPGAREIWLSRPALADASAYDYLDKTELWELTEEAENYSLLMDFIKTLPFKATGRMLIIYDDAATRVPAHKTRAGDVTEVPEAFAASLRAMVRDLNWTGGAELEMVRDADGKSWLLEMDPRFPAWIHGGTLAGFNLPAKLVKGASGVKAQHSPSFGEEFTRVVLEVPVRSQYPLPPLPEPFGGGGGHSLKHPSGLLGFANRLHAMNFDGHNGNGNGIHFSLLVISFSLFLLTERDIFEKAKTICCQRRGCNSILFTPNYKLSFNNDYRIP